MFLGTTTTFIFRDKFPTILLQKCWSQSLTALGVTNYVVYVLPHAHEKHTLCWCFIEGKLYESLMSNTSMYLASMSYMFIFSFLSQSFCVIEGTSPNLDTNSHNFCFFPFQKNQLPHLGWIIDWSLTTAPVFSHRLIPLPSLAHVKSPNFFCSGRKPVDCLMLNAMWWLCHQLLTKWPWHLLYQQIIFAIWQPMCHQILSLQSPQVWLFLYQLA